MRNAFLLHANRYATYYKNRFIYCPNTIYARDKMKEMPRTPRYLDVPSDDLTRRKRSRIESLDCTIWPLGDGGATSRIFVGSESAARELSSVLRKQKP